MSVKVWVTKADVCNRIHWFQIAKFNCQTSTAKHCWCTLQFFFDANKNSGTEFFQNSHKLFLFVTENIIAEKEWKFESFELSKKNKKKTVSNKHE